VTTDPRLDLADAFAAQHGYAAATWSRLAQDGSARRYFRLTGGPPPPRRVDAPPPAGGAAFLRIGRHLAGLGLSVPEIIAADAAAGLLLLEDFGDALFSAAPAEPFALADAATDVLVAMQQAPPPPGLPAWDAAAMIATTLATLADWWWPAMHHAPAPANFRRDLTDALAALLAPLADTPPVFVHRDYFAANLIWLPDRTALRRVGVLDFQSAALGHPAYDLASLTQDARRDTHPAVQQRAITRYLTSAAVPDPDQLHAALAACAAQRHLRVAGLWVRLARRDGKPHYLVHGPRTWALLEGALHHPACRPLRDALDVWIPEADRRNPPGLAR
jgi:aminoglycoside/choline kinase family phosphotransferase